MDLGSGLGWTYDNVKYHAKRTLGGDEKRVVRLPGNRGQGGTIISESGLYKLIMRSDKPQAKAFQDWVTKEVLPSIRKTGSFVTGQPSLQIPTMRSRHIATAKAPDSHRGTVASAQQNPARASIACVVSSIFMSSSFLFLLLRHSRSACL